MNSRGALGWAGGPFKPTFGLSGAVQRGAQVLVRSLDVGSVWIREIRGEDSCTHLSAA
jgi:hypothetical protein